ncbi:hypothetical protein KGQ20_09345 [Catenulispora sp. NF23]|uniref:hypothetical protein n=1 Tax=Catenulispora pinistramenti TaxID=2705254 RepID=UPI001BABD3C6|nr:hypothetical protein [Catenulispora pinistramenti]MBS2532979.1 hypothetical protein [Catenulispora pinistramenti]
MAEASVPAPGSPREVLAGLGDLTRRVRTAQRGTWFPLLLLGLLLAGGIVVDRLTHSAHGFPCPPGAATGIACVRVKQGSPLYWSLGLVLVYAATAFFYLRRARSRGVGTLVRPFVIAGIVIVLLVAPTRFWTGGVTAPGAPVDFFGLHFHAAPGTASVLSRLTGRAVSVGVPLLVLSWIERNLALLLFTVAYLVIELVPITVAAGGTGPVSPWSALPGLAVPAGFLLLGALAFAVAQRPAMPRTPAAVEPAAS